jgi:hypothetical protein
VGFHALRSVDPDERGWRRCRPSRRPHMPFPERPSRQAVFGREINRLLLSNAPTENACVGRSIQDAHRGSWDFPAVSPRLRRARSFRVRPARYCHGLFGCSLRFVGHALVPGVFCHSRAERVRSRTDE